MTAYIVTSTTTGAATVADAGDLARALSWRYSAADDAPGVLQALDDALATGDRRRVRRLCRYLRIAINALD